MDNTSKTDPNKISQKQIKEYLNTNHSDSSNPTQDIGHSYSFHENNDDKIIANLDLIGNEIKSLLEGYTDIIFIDSDLYNRLVNIKDSFKKDIEANINQTAINNNFNDIISELQSKNNNSERFDNFVEKLKEIQKRSTEKY